VIFNLPGGRCFSLALHRRWWTPPYFVNEAGCLVVQVGPFITEIVYRAESPRPG
jgi:hypothetical protein